MVRQLRRAIVSIRQQREEGQGLAEYALILGLIALVCIGALTALGGAIVTSPGFTVLAAL